MHRRQDDLDPPMRREQAPRAAPPIQQTAVCRLNATYRLQRATINSTGRDRTKAHGLGRRLPWIWKAERLATTAET
jgi:hypothetical protein